MIFCNYKKKSRSATNKEFEYLLLLKTRDLRTYGVCLTGKEETINGFAILKKQVDII